MVQLARCGFVSHADIPALRAQFDTENCLCLRDLIHPELRPLLAAKLGDAQFATKHYDTVGDEFRMAPNLASGALQLMLNDEAVFSWVRRVTGCAPIGCFNGRIYRMTPGQGHSFAWHDDCPAKGNRLITLSIDLSATPYSGGTLEIRRTDSKEIVFRASRLNWGDALLFPISRSLEHRVTPVEGADPKIAFAGWFQKEPVFSAALNDRVSLASMVC
jgi:hypothetical protein